jgi:hypothetical protein
MSFVVTKEPTFTHTVTVPVPVDGGHVEEKFKATFRVIDSKKIEDFDLDTEKGSTEILQAVIVKLDDLVDANDQAMPYSDALRDQLIQVPYVRAALGKAYFAAIGRAARGN